MVLAFGIPFFTKTKKSKNREFPDILTEADDLFAKKEYDEALEVLRTCKVRQFINIYKK